jgi:hypothetical protein
MDNIAAAFEKQGRQRNRENAAEVAAAAEEAGFNAAEHAVVAALARRPMTALKWGSSSPPLHAATKAANINTTKHWRAFLAGLLRPDSPTRGGIRLGF